MTTDAVDLHKRWKKAIADVLPSAEITRAATLHLETRLTLGVMAEFVIDGREMCCAAQCDSDSERDMRAAAGKIKRQLEAKAIAG